MRLQATLPTLGTVPVDFHQESARVLDYLGPRELDRLRQVPHLGVAATVFTGVHHSRLEYVLLQCAIIGLLGKLYRHNETFAISNAVSLDGMQRQISSGEELLKCWALLSNFGHAQYTYGVERALLQAARRHRGISNWLCSSARHADLRAWCRDVIANYRDGQAHFLLSIARVYQGPSHDRRKGECAHYLRNLLLPPEQLFPKDYSRRYKLTRLRQLFARIRLLSIVTLDSYYSHNPLRLQLESALLSLVELTASPGKDNGFERVISETAGWLADELYLHPRCVAVQREYEVRLESVLSRRFEKLQSNPGKLNAFVKNFMWSGFGRPTTAVLVPLLRLTFETTRQPMLGRHDLCDTLRQLETDLAAPPATYLSLDRNRHSRAVHLDLLYKDGVAASPDIARVFSRVYRWLVRTVEADALARVRSTFPASERSNEQVLRTYQHRFVRYRLAQEQNLLCSVFNSLISYVLADAWSGSVSEFEGMDRLARPVWLRVSGSDGEVYDDIAPELVRQIEDNPRGYSADRLQELRTLQRVLAQSKAPFVLACTEKFVVRDQYGKPRDDWDGVLLEISDDGVQLTIVEGKNLGSKKKNETEAFKQLGATVDFICARRGLSYRRRRIAGLGAALTCSMRIQQVEAAP